MTRLLNVRQAQRELGLTAYAIYKAVHLGQLDPMQVGGKGRLYYSEKQLRMLTGAYHLAAA